ncbi:HFL327Cp [Eremothecium sinecaudum]|uniref:HFL327Cp n=1 Tax=Eremothecium sinecaudum TaxID=45286 RepID=A0A0X8HU66_9SACH|nr:HFL327Cp [Eremothecium sinecaudum]AMD21529.1 HFL327Cp [Eremothecium sinecaudum]
MYIPPLNFSLVVSQDVSLYRSGYPMPLNYPFIKNQLHLGTVIYVGDKDISEDYKQFLETEGIRYHHIYMESSRDGNIQQGMERVLKLVLNVDNYPILIHSNKGKHRVGVIVGIIRKILQGWSVTGIYQEYGIFSGGQKDQVDLEYITMFEATLPAKSSKIPSFVRFDSIESCSPTDCNSSLL